MNSPNPDQLLQGLLEFQFLLRSEYVTQAREAEKKKRVATDVTGIWLGFNSEGMGRVKYDGQIYVAKVMSSTCKQKYAKVNLRRTKLNAYVDWQ